MAEHVGDGDQVGAAADEGGGEGVAADVGGDVLFVEVGVGGDGSDDVAGSSAGLVTGAGWSSDASTCWPWLFGSLER